MSSFALSLLIAASTIGSSASVAPPDGVFDPPASIRHQLEEAASKQAAYEEFQKIHGAETKNWATELPPPVYDVSEYEIEVYVDPDRQVLSGSVTMTLTAVEDGLAVVDLDADLGLRVFSVLQLADNRVPYDTPTELVFEHDDDHLVVTLVEPLTLGARVALQITYGGHAWRGGLIGATGVNWHSNAGTPVIHTFAQPYGARVWWPCNDRPDDKAIVTLRVTYPEDLDVAANGFEVSNAPNGDGTSTSVWWSSYPVSTYLVVMHISDFVYSESTYTGLDGDTTMPVGLWAMPPVADQAEADLAVTVPQIEVMAGHWGEYPFIEEKYGNATVFFGGGMEHQTMTTLAVYRVGDPWMQWLNVHELGHQWWGDWITMDDWRHIWLNEGYATHTEWLWAEHLGPDVLNQYLADEDWRGWFSGSVYDNPEPFSWTIYAKGSWVVWMLRHVLGDETFFQAMTAYRSEYGGGTATTEDLENAMESGSGLELDWFFDQWVYGLYRPRYVYSWENSTGNLLQLTVRQEQTNTGLFRMPVDIRVTTAAGAEDHREIIEARAEQIIEIQLQAEAESVVLDPETHILCEIAHISEPDLELGPDFPDGYDFGVVPGSATASLMLPMTNVGGADLVIDEVRPQDGSAFRLIDPPAFPLTIEPGQTHELEIEFDPTGFGARGDWFFIASNDPDRDGRSYLRVTGVGTLYDEAQFAAPSSASAGTVAVGGTAEASFNALNLGGQPLTVLTELEGDGFVLGKTIPSVFAPGSSNEVIVRFHPNVEGPSTGSVIFHQGDPTNPLKTVRLSGVGQAAPRIHVDPPVLSLGVGGEDISATLHVSNTGGEPLRITAMDLVGPYRLSLPIGLPVEILPGAMLAIEIGLHPDFEGTIFGHIGFYSNDPGIPVARVPLRAHVTDSPVGLASFPAAASGPGLGDTFWSSRAYLLNPGEAALQTDMFFRPEEERETDHPDVGYEISARSQRVIPNLVTAAGSQGSGGINLRTSDSGLIAVSRTFASGSGGTYGQFIGGRSHDDALTGDTYHVLAGLAGNGGFHTNVGVLNLGEENLAVDVIVYNSDGGHLGTKRINAVPGGFKQVVSLIDKLTDELVRGGYATLAAVDPGAVFLAYASVVDDASSDPTLVEAQEMGLQAEGVDLIVPTVANLPGYLGTHWRSQLDVVNTLDIALSVTLEYLRSNGTTITSMPTSIAAGASLHSDDVVGGLFGETGKGSLRITSSDSGVHATSRTYNDDPSGTYGQLIPAIPITSVSDPGSQVVLAGLSSAEGFRTNLGLTSVNDSNVVCAIGLFRNDGAGIGEIEVEVPAFGFVQIERVLADEFGFTGEAWAEGRCTGTAADVVIHGSVIDETTGDPTYIPGIVLQDSP